MVVSESGRMDHWRKLFRNSDIFDVIENSILIAASDCPLELRDRRARIAEMLFSCRAARCLGCNHVELQVPEQEDEGRDFRRGEEGIPSDGCGGKESKVNSSCGGGGGAAGMTQMVSNCSFDEVEALTEEIEEEGQIVGEVLRIKGVLANKNDVLDSVLFDSLRKLQLMTLSVETLQVTEIGKAVNGLRKHRSKQIRHLVRTLIEEWKVLVDDWVASAPALEEATPESMNPSSFDEDAGEGLPSPPLDEGAFLATQTTSLEFSKFFDGMDDDGNPQGVAEFNRYQEIGSRPRLENCSNSVRNQQPMHPSSLSDDKVSIRTQDGISKQNWHQENKQSKVQESSSRTNRLHECVSELPKSNAADPGSSGTRPERHPNPSNICNSNVVMKSHQELAPGGIEKKPPTVSHVNLKNSGDNSIRAKLEMAKRRLHERYQEAENAKKQRTIQVMELHDLPKQAVNSKPFHPKQGNLARNWANGRH